MDHRRTAGKFYTPRPVVQYIVRQTFDWLRHEGRADHDLRILEPACGEGIFLLEAHRYLMADASFRGRSPEQVLRSNLYGIDRDPQAVMKTRQVLAAEVAANDQERQQLEISLAQNIRCGDALVDCDFETKSLLPSVVQSLGGGFDAVIGNPPYVNIRLLTQHYGEMVKDYLRQHFRCASGAYDLYVLFFELALRLLRPGGVCGMIVPNKLATLDYARVCRSMLLQETTLLQITDLSRCRVFPHAGVYPYIVIWQKKLNQAISGKIYFTGLA